MRPDKKVYRYIQWATGGVGQKCIRAIANMDHLEIVGAWVSSDAKHGKDIGTIAGIEPIGITATMNAEEIYALEADIVHYAPALPNWPEVIRLLESGKNVISPLHFTLLSSDPALMQQLHEAGLKGNVSYYGTGIYPDWASTRLVLLCTAVSGDIRKISLIEQNAKVIDFGAVEPIIFDILRFGSPPELAHEVSVASIAFHDCLRQELKNVGAGLGYEVDEVTMSHDHALATEDIHRPQYQRFIAKGSVGAWKSIYTGYIKGKPILEYTSYHAADARYIDRLDWHLEDEASYSIVIDGNPPTHLKWTTLATPAMSAAKAVFQATVWNNVGVIPGVCSAKPGIVSSIDMQQMLCGYKRLALN